MDIKMLQSILPANFVVTTKTFDRLIYVCSWRKIWLL